MTGRRRSETLAALSLRPLDPSRDYEPIADLISTTNAADDLDWHMTAASLRHEVAPGGQFEPERDTRVAEVDGSPVGFVRVYTRTRGPERKVVHRMDVWTRQAWRRRGVGTVLVAWAEERSRGLMADGIAGPAGAVHELAGFCDDRNAGSAAFAEALGFGLIRYTFEMRCRLDVPIPDAPLPPGLQLRPVRPADHRRIWDANIEAFRDHWEPAERTEADYRAWFADPDTDTTLWRVAWAGDEVAGLSMNIIYAEENERLGIKAGWLEQVSVRRPWRRRGLGAAVIAASLRAFRDRGMDEAMLGVDAENPTGALALYERLGFTRHRTFRVYRKRL
ncbi:MAG TPA: GNAT family N-acetyltransferase [Candidatus Deferrimicrobiaceae bacterium]|nr:GNAT family N-acetyltransferase [Candidatus Deferrimicrobiaceae bacterium]